VMVVTLPISALADMARTLANVTAAGVSATIVARQEGLLDDERFAAREPVELEFESAAHTRPTALTDEGATHRAHD
jgi:Na+/H+-dicarboxylate symporter